MGSSAPLRIGMVAGEASGDLLAGLLLDGLKARWPQVEAMGIGGPQMQRRGFQAWWPHDRLSVFGYVDALGRLPELLRVRVDRVEMLTAGGDGPCSFFGQQTPYVNPTIRPLCVGEFDFAPNSKHIVGAPSPQTDRTGTLWVFDKFSNGKANDFLYEVGQITTNTQEETVTAIFLPVSGAGVGSFRPFSIAQSPTYCSTPLMPT